MNNVSFANATRNDSALFWGTAVPLIALLIYVLLPATSIGFVSDDLVHLVEDAGRPWYDSSDHLNRPLRNGVFRMLPVLFGLNPLPYRLLAFLFYGLTALLLFRFVRQLGMRRGSALAVTVLFAFFPRNYEALFWFGAFQDLIVSSCILFACSAWLSYLQTGYPLSFIAAHFGYIVALGFKETAVGLPVVLLCLELSRTGTRGSPGFWGRLRRYLLFVPILAVFGGYVLLEGSSASSFQHARGIYVGTSPAGVIPPLVRTLVNIILQFSPAVGLHDLSVVQIAIVVVGCILIAIAVWLSANPKLALFGLCWFLVFTLPTAAFARSVNADRYLMLPYIAILFVVAGVVDQLYPLRRWQALVLAAALLVYAIEGSQRLSHFREAYRQAAAEVETVSGDAARLISLPSLSNEAEVVLVNLTHTREVYVLNNGAKGALMEKGLPRQVRVVYNSSQLDPQQESLVQSLNSCSHVPASSSGTRILLFSVGHLIDVSGPCSIEAVQTDRRNRPYSWTQDPPP